MSAKSATSLNSPMPQELKGAQATPAFAPVYPTQVRLSFEEAATVTGNSPGMWAGLPTWVRLVAFVFEILNWETVLEPALTEKTYCSRMFC